MNGVDATSIEHGRVVGILSSPGDVIEIIAERPKPLRPPLVNGEEDDNRMSYATNISIPSPREEIVLKDVKFTNNNLNFTNLTDENSLGRSPTKRNPNASLPRVVDAPSPKKVVDAPSPKKVVGSPVPLGSVPGEDSVDAPAAKLSSGPVLHRPPSVRSQKNSVKEEEEEDDGDEKPKAKKVDESRDGIGSAELARTTKKKAKKSKPKKSSVDAEEDLQVSRSFEDLQVVDADNDAQENNDAGAKVNMKKKRNKSYPIEV